jgi:hypothetical protein
LEFPNTLYFASGVTLVDAPLLLDEDFGLEEVSLTIPIKLGFVTLFKLLVC